MKNNFLRLQGKSITNKREKNDYLSRSTPEVFPFLKQIDNNKQLCVGKLGLPPPFFRFNELYYFLLMKLNSVHFMEPLSPSSVSLLPPKDFCSEIFTGNM